MAQHTPDGRCVLGKIEWATQLQTFDLETGKLLGSTPAPVGHLLGFAPNRRWHAYTAGEREVIVEHTGRPRTVLARPPGRDGGWRADPGSRFLAGIFGSRVIVWDVASGKQVLALDHPAPVCIHTGVAWSPDGKRLATVTQDRVVRLWRAADGKVLRACNLAPGSPHPVGQLVWNRDGTGLWASVDTSYAHIDVETGRVRHQEGLPSGTHLVGLDLAADGNSLLAQVDVGGRGCTTARRLGSWVTTCRGPQSGIPTPGAARGSDPFSESVASTPGTGSEWVSCTPG